LTLLLLGIVFSLNFFSVHRDMSAQSIQFYFIFEACFLSRALKNVICTHITHTLTHNNEALIPHNVPL
jgi:hypothetical protein